VESGFSVALDVNETVCIEKIVAISTSKSDDVKEPLGFSKHLVETADSFKSILAESEKAWEKIWKKIDTLPEKGEDKTGTRLLLPK